MRYLSEELTITQNESILKNFTRTLLFQIYFLWLIIPGSQDILQYKAKEGPDTINQPFIAE